MAQSTGWSSAVADAGAEQTGLRDHFYNTTKKTQQTDPECSEQGPLHKACLGTMH